MVEYRIVNYCRLCHKRYVLNKGEQKQYYCDECREKHNELKNKELKNNKG